MTRSVTSLNAAEWQAWATAHGAPLLQQAPWGELKHRFGWQVRRLLVRDGEAEAAAQLLLRRRFGFAVGYVPHGPIFSGDAATDRALLQSLRRLAWRSAMLFIRLEPGLPADEPAAQGLATMLRTDGLQEAAPLQPRTTITLNIAPQPADLLRACSKGHRADISRAERLGVQIRVAGVEDIATFSDLMQTTGRRALFQTHSADYYAAALSLHGARARLFLAEIDGAAVAGHLYIADGQTAAYLYSGANETGLKSGANHLIGWHAIQWARSIGCQILDFWGVPDALGAAAATEDPAAAQQLLEQAQADPLSGVYRYKKGFGGQLMRRLPAYDLVVAPPSLYRLALSRLHS